MEYIFGVGFLGTRAPYFIDIVLIVAITLPFLLMASIICAIKGYYKLHRFLQSLLFLVTLIALLMVQYELYFLSTFEAIIEKSHYNPNSAYYLYVAHTVLAAVTVILWYSTLHFAKEDNKRRALPGLYSNSHKRMGRISSVFIVLTALSTVALYWVLFAT